jgi:hypothetical protein
MLPGGFVSSFFDSAMQNLKNDRSNKVFKGEEPAFYTAVM